MKTVYILYDKTAKEIATCFLANNDKHAIKMFRNELQRQPQDIEVDLYSVSECEVIDTKDSIICRLTENNNPIYSYPETTCEDKNKMVEEILKEE